jgi:type III pantothenate kinase
MEDTDSPIATGPISFPNFPPLNPMATPLSMPPLVAVDIGNSRIKLGRFGPVTGPRSGGAATRSLPEPVDTLDLPLTNRAGEFDSAPLARWCSAADVGNATWLVASVHRGAAERLTAAVGALTKLKLLTYRDVPLTLAVDTPERVGIDRLLGALAANYLRRPDRAAIVIDMGTAITVDLLTAAGEFAGGAILPGLATSAHALEQQTDALPHVDIERWKSPPQPLGKATVPAIESGLFWGAVGAIRELVERLSSDATSPPDVFVTGGSSQLVAEQLVATHRLAVEHLPHLVLSGIAIASQTDVARDR